jgi:hypothetical protein
MNTFKINVIARWMWRVLFLLVILSALLPGPCESQIGKRQRARIVVQGVRRYDAFDGKISSSIALSDLEAETIKRGIVTGKPKVFTSQNATQVFLYGKCNADSANDFVFGVVFNEHGSVAGFDITGYNAKNARPNSRHYTLVMNSDTKLMKKIDSIIRETAVDESGRIGLDGTY